MSSERVLRYVEIGEHYACTEFDSGSSYAALKPIASMPEWLQLIVLAAKMGGHVIVPVTRPPDLIIWFSADKDNNLTSFLELTYARLAYVR
jgi:hypothetical protein